MLNLRFHVYLFVCRVPVSCLELGWVGSWLMALKHVISGTSSMQRVKRASQSRKLFPFFGARGIP